MARNQRKQQRNKQHDCKIVAETVRTRGTIDPKPVLTSLVLTYKAQLQVPLTSTANAHIVTLSEIASRIPGGSTLWPKMRITHYEAWGGDTADTAPLTLTMRTSSGEEFGGDNASFSDAGTFGRSRPHVSVRPGLFQRLQWADSASVNGVIRLQQALPASSSSNVILHVTVEVRSSSIN